MATSKKSSEISKQSILQLKISLLDSDPIVWRRFLVPANFTVFALHEVIQPVMGWQNSHLFNFEISGSRYGDPDSEPDENEKNAKHFKLCDVLKKVKNFQYVYDFGDDWQHEVVVEKVLKIEDNTNYPLCIGGENACPPEDCHGIHGYSEFLKVLKNPTHEDHEETKGWIGGYFDPTAFDPNIINREFLWADQ